MTPQERETLLDELIEGSIGEADLLRIEAELSVDPEVRQQYYRRIQLDLLLEREANAEDEKAKVVVANETGRVQDKAGVWVGILIGLAASLLLALTWYELRPSEDQLAKLPSDSLPAEPSANGFAIVNGLVDASWQGTSLQVGDLIPGGPLNLVTGRMYMELFSGVQLVIEGDALFSIDSPMQVTMKRGLARARVPEPAKGFVIKTNSGDVVDLGTEFAVRIDDDKADVAVIEGEVEVLPSGSESRRLLPGMPLSFDVSGNITESTTSELNLIGPNDFQTLQDQQQQRRITRWRQATEQLRKDTRLVAHYQFSTDRKHSREIRNLAIGHANAASEGAIVATSSAGDRWGRNNGAIDFSRIGSRVRVNVPGQHRGLTLNCWVKINSLDRWYNSLFLTDGHEQREPHWQIMDDGRIFFSIKIPDQQSQHGKAKQHVYYSPSIWDSSLSGRWIMLSVVYDVDGKMVTHYLNGKAICSESIPPQALVDNIQIGPASIGNWSEPMYRTDAKFVVRNLNGSMDELAVFSGALSSEEVLNLYRTGNPDDF